MREYSLGSIIRAATWGALLGGAAGFTIGLMLAPVEGEKMRRRTTYRLERLAENISDVTERLLETRVESEARRSGDAIVADAHERAQRIRDDIDALLGEMRQQGTSATNK